MTVRVEDSNKKALEIILKAQPVWIDVKPARELLDLDRETILHAGPPVTWEKMCGPMKGAVIGAILYEGLAGNEKEAAALAPQLKFQPCNERGAVGPMTGIITGSMPLVVIENQTGGNRAYSTINEGMGQVIRFGAYGPPVVEHLRWIEKVLAPVLARIVNRIGGMDMRSIISQALSMGDELHMRNHASTCLLLRELAVEVVAAAPDPAVGEEILTFLSRRNDQFFLNFGMAAAKATMDAAHKIKGSSIVTAISRNGYEVGIRVSGLGERWFVAPSPEVETLFFSGFGPQDACPDLGDSAIMECIGVGGMVMAASPAIVPFLGADSFQASMDSTADMYEITAGESPHYAIPALNMRGAPTGIDLLKVVETGIVPSIHTAVAHREAGRGMVGAGISRLPAELFEQAFLALSEELEIEQGEGS